MSLYSTTQDGLPDPEFRPEFYAETPVKRLIAWILDTVAIAVICALIVPFTAFTALFFLPFLFLVVGFVYRSLSLASASATPGMRFVALEFRRHDGERFDRSTALMHTLLYSLWSGMVLPQIVSVALMLLSPRKQGLTDLMLGTAALNRAARV